MNYFLKGLIGLSTVSLCLCQYYQQENAAPPQYRPQPPSQPQPQPQYYREPYAQKPIPPQILSHKQAQNHDGNFKYAFAAENGLAQGESIAPDGSRIGGYTYVDPNGKTISVKYTAGKEGFKILEGDHIPRDPVPAAPAVPQHAQAAQAGYAPQPHFLSVQQPSGAEDDGQYRPEQYENTRPVSKFTQAAFVPQRSNYAPPPPPPPQPQQVYRQQVSDGNTLEHKDYSVSAGQPYSFGNGFSFEFGG